MTVGNALRLTRKFSLWPIEHEPYRSNRMLAQCQELIPLLKSCTRAFEISQIHGWMVKTSLDHDIFTLSKLLASSIQDVAYAASVFNHIKNPTLFMFNTMLRAYSISDDPKQAFGILNDMRARGVMLDQFSFITTLKACSRELDIQIGQGIHGVVMRSGHVMFVHVRNSLLRCYCACGRIEDAHQLFDEFPQENDLVSWNTLMGGYLHASQPTVIVDLFRQMCGSGFRASVSTVLSVLSAIGELGHSLGGESVHGHCIKIGCCYYLNVVTALIDMYAKTGQIYSARRIFSGVPGKDVILWNCMIDKYAKSGQIEESLALLQLMKHEQIKPNSSTLAGLLSACANSGCINVGRCLGDYVKEEGLKLDAVLGTALVDMYAKCGLLEKAIDVFEQMESKDVKSWTALISGYGVHGQARNAITLFHRMEMEGVKPNEVTFLAALSACSHGGLVTEGMACFDRMIQEYGFLPKVEHYGCMIDLLGRAGLLREAHDLIQSLPIKSDATAWRALLAACRIYGNVELGERVKRELDAMDDEHPTDLMLLSSTYAIAGRLPDITRSHEMIEDNMIKEAGKISVGKKEEKILKEAGHSTIEMDPTTLVPWYD